MDYFCDFLIEILFEKCILYSERKRFFKINCLHDIEQSHVLTASSKFHWAYNVKSSSTNFPHRIQWNFKTSYPCVRFIYYLGCNLITEIWDLPKWDFSDPCIIELKKHALKCDIMLWKTFIRVSIDFNTYQEWAEIYFTIH